MKIIEGDLLVLAESKQFDVIVHGCNCFHTMGSGIAAQIAKKYPQALQADKLTPYGSKEKLGTYSQAQAPGFVICNAYTQHRYGTDQPHVDYEAVKRVFEKIANDFSGLRIGYPMIGAGLAGGDWTRLSQIIETALQTQDHTLVKWVPPASSNTPPTNGQLL